MDSLAKIVVTVLAPLLGAILVFEYKRWRERERPPPQSTAIPRPRPPVLRRLHST